MKITGRVTKAMIMATMFAFTPFTQLSADERTPEEMLSIAESIFGRRIQEMRGRQGTENTKKTFLDVTANSSDIIENCRKESFKVYSFSDGTPGYVIVSADDCLPEVIGFSDNREFSKENIPDALRDILTVYTNALNSNDGYGMANTTYAADNHSSVEPLLGEISYNQGAPFNNKCPMHEGKRSVTGCGATAMAEIMAYHRYPTNMRGDVINYTTRTHSIPVTWDCAGTVFDWDNILDKYTHGATFDKIESFTTSDNNLCVATNVLLSSYEDKIAVENIFNVTMEKLDLSIALILADNNGNLLHTISKAEDKEFAPQALMSRFYFDHIITNEVEDGEYRIYIGIRNNATSTWTILKRATDSSNLYKEPYEECYLTLKKSGKSYTIGDKSFVCAYSQKESDAIATLMAACGAASEMDYSNSSSGSYQIYQMRGWHNYLGYDDSMTYIENTVFSNEGWHNRIQKELLEERPIYCAGYAEDGPGHAYVIDGYKYVDGTPYYHINWGWGGVSDGYFTITHMTPGDAGTGGEVTNYGYKVNLTVNIMPDDGKDAGATLGVVELAIDKSSAVSNESITVSAYSITNYTVGRFEGDILIYAVGEDGDEYLLGSYFSGITMDFFLSMFDTNRVIEIPDYIPTGEYSIEMRTLTKESDVETLALTAALPTLYIENTVESEETFNLTVSSVRYASMYLDYPVAIPTGVEVYTADRVEGNLLKMKEVTGVIPANTGVIVKAAEGIYTFTQTDETPDIIENNLLKGTTTDTYITPSSSEKHYVLSVVDNVVGMYCPKLNGEGKFMNNANSAYMILTGFNVDSEGNLDTNNPGTQLSNGYRFDFSGTTSIEEVVTESTTAVPVYYDLSGRRVENPTKGIYIFNGKKVLVK